jgi:hypothetical protein
MVVALLRQWRVDGNFHLCALVLLLRLQIKDARLSSAFLLLWLHGSSLLVLLHYVGHSGLLLFPYFRPKHLQKYSRRLNKPPSMKLKFFHKKETKLSDSWHLLLHFSGLVKKKKNDVFFMQHK